MNVRWEAITVRESYLSFVSNTCVISSLRRRQSKPLVYTVCVLVHNILFQILLGRKDIYTWVVASDWSKPLFEQTQGRNKLIRSNYIFSCDSVEFETRYRALIWRRLKPLFWHKQTGCSAGWLFLPKLNYSGLHCSNPFQFALYKIGSRVRNIL